jgi:hypothetical protein
MPQQNESWYAYPRWSAIYVGCFLQLLISHFGSCFTKIPDFGAPKMESDSFGGIPTPLRLCVHWNSSQVGPHGLPIWLTSNDGWSVDFLLYFVWLGYRSTEQHRGVQEPP